LSEGAPAASIGTWVSACRTPFILAGGSVYRLGRNPDGGVLARWTPISVPALPGDVASEPIAGLASTGRELFVSSATGTAWRVDLACDGGTP
jgi:hypothetical protein